MSDASTRQAIEAVFRIERSKLIAGLARMLRDLDAAEELAQDAFLAAFTDWPVTGIPDNPGAWLMTTAKRRAIDAIRRRQLHDDKEAFLVDDAEQAKPFASIEDIEAAMDHDIGDQRLGLIFTACHPVLTADARAALTLRLLGGLDTGEIGRAFLTSEATIAQRIVRAKRAIGEAGVAFEVPRGTELAPRLASVLEVIETARAVTGRAIPLRFAPARTGDPPRLVADAGKARRVLGWKPEVSFPELVRRMVFADIARLRGQVRPERQAPAA